MATTPKTWTDAVGVAMSSTGDARTGAGNPKLTNQQASGLIMFARDVMAYAASQGRPVAYDWYGYALPALGWEKRGDRFDTTPAHQAADYPTANELWMALQEIATQLDSAGIPFKLLSSPVGSASTYDALARAAWVDMQANHPLDAEASKAKKAAPSAAAPANDKLPDSFTDENGIVWSLKKQGSTVTADVVTPQAPYSSSQTGATKAAALAAVKKYAHDMATKGASSTPSGDLDAGDIYPSSRVPTKPNNDSGGAMVLVGIAILIVALDD